METKDALILGAVAVAAVVAWRVVGAAGQAVGAVGSAVADGVSYGADAALSGTRATVGAVSNAVGLPTPTQTTTDARVARWIIDNAGYFAASKWCGVPALVAGAAMDRGTGTPPPAGSAAAREFAHLIHAAPSASYDESERLAKRYPAPSVSSGIFDPTYWN